MGKYISLFNVKNGSHMGKGKNIEKDENFGLIILSNAQFFCHSSIKEEGWRLDKYQGHNRENWLIHLLYQ